MQHVISPVPSFGRYPSRKKPPTSAAGSYTLKYIDSWKFSSGPTSCMYSSCGSSRTAMPRTLPATAAARGTVRQRGRGAEMSGQVVDGRVRVDTARVRHHIHGSAADRAVLDARDCVAVGGHAPARQSE